MERHLIQYKDSDPIEMRFFFNEHSGNIYHIVYSTRINEPYKFQKELNGVLQSFKIVKFYNWKSIKRFVKFVSAVPDTKIL